MKNYKSIINLIEKTRSKNNKNWMDLLRIALKYAPKESSSVLKKINTNDKKISQLLNKMLQVNLYMMLKYFDLEKNIFIIFLIKKILNLKFEI